jgi:hypothetical protein
MEKVKVLLYQMLPDIRKRSSFGQVSQASPGCPSGSGQHAAKDAHAALVE